MEQLLVLVPPLVFGVFGFTVRRWRPAVVVTAVAWSLVLVALFASGGGMFGPWLLVGPWIAFTTASIACAVAGVALRDFLKRRHRRRKRLRQAG